jgi:hypothetical protein
MDEIVTNVRRVSDLMTEISTASQQQSDDIQQMNHAVDLIDQGTQQNAALVEEASAAARSMEEQSAQLLQTVASFRVQGGAGHRHGGGAARGLGAATGLFFLGFGVAAYAVAAGMLGAVQGLVGAFDQAARIAVFAGCLPGHADADGDGGLGGGQGGGFDGSAQAFAQAQGVGGIGRGQGGDELFAAVAGQQVVAALQAAIEDAATACRRRSPSGWP